MVACISFEEKRIFSSSNSDKSHIRKGRNKEGEESCLPTKPTLHSYYRQSRNFINGTTHFLASTPKSSEINSSIAERMMIHHKDKFNVFWQVPSAKFEKAKIAKEKSHGFEPYETKTSPRKENINEVDFVTKFHLPNNQSIRQEAYKKYGNMFAASNTKETKDEGESLYDPKIDGKKDFILSVPQGKLFNTIVPETNDEEKIISNCNSQNSKANIKVLWKSMANTNEMGNGKIFEALNSMESQINIELTKSKANPIEEKDFIFLPSEIEIKNSEKRRRSQLINPKNSLKRESITHAVSFQKEKHLPLHKINVIQKLANLTQDKFKDKYKKTISTSSNSNNNKNNTTFYTV